jgi:hypothetical protein
MDFDRRSIERAFAIPWHKVDNTKGILPIIKRGFQDIGLGEVRLSSRNLFFQAYTKMPSLRIQQSSKRRGIIEVWKTTPIDTSTFMDEGCGFAISNHSVSHNVFVIPALSVIPAKAGIQNRIPLPAGRQAFSRE